MTVTLDSSLTISPLPTLCIEVVALPKSIANPISFICVLQTINVVDGGMITNEKAAVCMLKDYISRCLPSNTLIKPKIKALVMVGCGDACSHCYYIIFVNSSLNFSIGNPTILL